MTKIKTAKEAEDLFHKMPNKQKEIALRYIENKILGREKENEKIFQKAVEDALDD